MPALEFKGKAFVYSYHLGVPYRELVAVNDKSRPSAGNRSSNLIVAGDSLYALKALLPRFAGKIKCIYCAPPYNTGSEGWHYSDNVPAPIMQAWQNAADKPVAADDPERHDKWLCMMWPRLQILHALLADWSAPQKAAHREELR
jgi:adenine-specific DNA-methyltransferase